VGLGFYWAFFCHAGSIAIGSLVIAVIRFFKYCVVYFAQKIERLSGENQVVKAMVSIATCILGCLEKICDYINESGFAYMAVSGENFCTSSWNGFLLNIKHMTKFSFANLLAKVFILLGKIAITVFNMFSLYYLMKLRNDLDEVSSLLAPMILVGVITLMTASIFLGLFDKSVLSLMTCMAIDIDMNDGAEPRFGPPTFHNSIGKIEQRDDNRYVRTN
jgi:choline transporter-like protein 2/4/5